MPNAEKAGGEGGISCPINFLFAVFDHKKSITVSVELRNNRLVVQQSEFAGWVYQ